MEQPIDDDNQILTRDEDRLGEDPLNHTTDLSFRASNELEVRI